MRGMAYEPDSKA